MFSQVTLLVQRLSREIWQNISLCGEIMKLGTLVGDRCRIIFRLGPNSETPLVAAILNFNMAAILHILLPTTLKLRQIEI